MTVRVLVGVLLVLGASVLPGDARAQGQLEDNLSAYTGPNAEGYLGPLRDALGGSLNSGIFMYAGVPNTGLHARLDFKGLLVDFKEEDRTFMATTDDYFGEPQTVTAPTVIGDEDAVSIEDDETGAIYTFPGGFDVGRFGLAAPQLTVGSIFSTEAVGRYMSVDTGEEIGDIKIAGAGLRHGVSNWLDVPFDLALTGFWQKIEIGDDFIEATAATLGGQIGKQFGLLHGYAGISYDTIDMEAKYEADMDGDSQEVLVDFEQESVTHFTLGATLRFGFLHFNGEFNQAENTSWAFGLGLGN